LPARHPLTPPDFGVCRHRDAVLLRHTRAGEHKLPSSTSPRHVLVRHLLANHTHLVVHSTKQSCRSILEPRAAHLHTRDTVLPPSSPRPSLMPNESRPDRIHPGSFSTQHVPVTPDFLPAPAVKLVVTQYLKTSVESPFWAWIIVGAFYDANNRIIWSARLFACQLDVDSEASSSDSESGTSSSSSSLSGESERSSTRMTPSPVCVHSRMPQVLN
jgi:hypothetical protein